MRVKLILPCVPGMRFGKIHMAVQALRTEDTRGRQRARSAGHQRGRLAAEVNGSLMLEQQGLLLGPWQPVPAGRADPRAARTSPGDWTRTVLDLATAERLGFARWRGGTSWQVLRWLASQVIKIYETEDASHLCTLRRAWGPLAAWQVHDAEERRVAVIYRRLILDGAGHRLARVERPPGGELGRFLGPQGQDMGGFRLGAEGTSLTFAPLLDNSPFARMALLGAALTAE
jgi:hypothetical protein